MPKTPKSKKAASPVATPSTTAKANAADAPRKLTPESFRSRRLRRKATRKEVHRTKLPNAVVLLAQSTGLMLKHWEVFGGALLIYALINLLLVGGINGGGDLSTLKDSLNSVTKGQFGQIGTGLSLFSFLVTSGTGTTASGVTSAYQTIALIMVSLALVWTFRQLYAGKKVRVRDGFYRGMYPLVPFILVLLYIGLQVIPALLGTFLFSSLVGSGLLTVFWQQAVISFVSFGLLCVTIYWLCSSVAALCVVTLPDMTPWRAIKMARDIVAFRRANILRKLLFLPLALLVPSALIMLPIVLFVTPLAVPVFFVLNVLAVGVVNSYLYALYRELIA